MYNYLSLGILSEKILVRNNRHHQLSLTSHGFKHLSRTPSLAGAQAENI